MSNSSASSRSGAGDYGCGPYYAVRVGRRPGIYRTWDECQGMTTNFSGAVFKKFKVLSEAQSFVGANAPARPAFSAANSGPGRTQRPAPYSVGNSRYTDKAGVLGHASGRTPSTRGRGASVGRVGRDSRARRLSAIQSRPVPPQAGEYPDKLVVYTDGASSGNGRQGARAGVGVYFGPGDARNVSEPLAGSRQTNQRAELSAILRAIEVAISGGGNKLLVICSDSMYSINCVNVWYHSWERKGWKNSKGDDVENQDLIKGILLRTREYGGSVEYIHVRGHAGIEGNEQADMLAVSGASGHGCQ